MSSPPTAPPSPPQARPDAEPPGPRPGALRRALAFLRNTWRGLTSMRTALVLLFLLALAALPGALLPQRSLNAELVDRYVADHPTLAPVLDAVGAFEVFASPWFAAIYLLLMISLIGCVLPRSLEYLRSARAAPVATPRNLARLPHHDVADLDESPDAVLERVRLRLRGWRRVEHAEPGGVRTVSAEKGYLRETGNLIFHLSLIGLLLGFAGGKLYGYEGDVIVLADGSEFCNTSILGYDTFRAGLRVDGTELNPFCVKVDRFDGSWLPNGQPSSFAAQIGYQSAADLDVGSTAWRPETISVNHPLRTDGDRAYLTGFGYAPRFTVTWPDGQTRTGQIQWRPIDRSTFLSEGATKLERPGVEDPAQRRTSQLALTGRFAPTAAVDTSGALVSAYPDLRNPVVQLSVLRGDLGIDDGRGQSIFTVDQRQVDSGELRRVAQADLAPGQSVRLDDGTTVRLDGVTPWVNVLVAHDPGQLWVLGFAAVMLGGLALSLSVKRRRFWVRIVPSDGGGSRVQLGGLARSDRAGYGEEFERLGHERCAGNAKGTVESMLVDPIMSLWSDRLFEAAVVVYLVALLAHSVEYVTARSSSVVVAAAAGGGGVAVADAPEGEPTGRTRSDRWGRMAVSLTILGVAVHLGSIVLRGLATSRWPLGNMYEFVAALCLFAVVAWLVLVRRAPKIRPIGVFVLTPVLILMFLAGTVLYARAAPVVPALQSYWLIIHVTTITLGSGLLLVPGVASILYLLKRYDRPAALVAKLPSAESLDRLAYRVTVVGFPLYTLGIICGAIWAEAAWSRFWGWDPKETVAFVAWVLYAAYLHARATSGWRNVGAAWINTAGFSTIVFNLFFINMVVAGLHSYAGV